MATTVLYAMFARTQEGKGEIQPSGNFILCYCWAMLFWEKRTENPVHHLHYAPVALFPRPPHALQKTRAGDSWERWSRGRNFPASSRPFWVHNAKRPEMHHVIMRQKTRDIVTRIIPVFLVFLSMALLGQSAETRARFQGTAPNPPPFAPNPLRQQLRGLPLPPPPMTPERRRRCRRCRSSRRRCRCRRNGPRAT